MRKTAIATALAVGLATTAFAQETVTKTEKTVTTNGSGSVTTERTETTTYETRALEAYRTVGVPQDVVIKLRDYDTKIVAARRANDIARVREYYTAQRRLLTPEQIERVRVYLREHPVTEKNYVTVWEEEPVVTREVKTVRSPGAEVRIEKPASEVHIERREVAPATSVKTEKVTTVETVE